MSKSWSINMKISFFWMVAISEPMHFLVPNYTISDSLGAKCHAQVGIGD
jgi:hypothetical protein